MLSKWIEQGVAAGEVQTRAVIETLFNQLKLGPKSKIPDPREAVNQFRDAIPKLPVAGLSKAMEDFLLASQLVGALNFQRRLGIATAGYDHAFMGTGDWFVCATPKLDPFAQPFDIAIQALRDRVLLPPETFDRLVTAARSRAGRIAGQQNVKLVKQIYEALVKVIEDGGTVRDFELAVAELQDLGGWGGTNPHHLRIVYQQNATMAFNAGHYASMRQADIGTYYWRSYQTSCPICQPYIDKKFTLDDRNPYPGGAHFGCDCWADPVLPGEDDGTPAIRIGQVVNPLYTEQASKPSALRYDPEAFASLEPISAGDVPRELRGQFEQYLADSQ